MNRVWVVTGASSGIGKALCETLKQDGETVYGLSRRLPKEEVGYHYLACDVTKPKEIEQAIQTIANEQGKIDVLVNCAGMGVSGAIEYTTLEEVNRIFQTNVMGVFSFTKAALPLLRQSEKPKVIQIGSVAGDLVIPFQTFYSMTKAAVHVFSEGLRMELRPFGIDVSVVLPGDTKTGFTAAREQPNVLENDVYNDRVKRSIARMEHDEQHGKSPMTVVHVVKRIAKKRRMPVKVTVGFEYKLFIFLKRILPKRFENWILYLMYGK